APRRHGRGADEDSARRRPSASRRQADPDRRRQRDEPRDRHPARAVVGMEPVAVELPVAALELIAEGEPFDVAVLDMMMPDMDGLALAGEIRQHRDESELPLLLLTSLGRLPQLQSGSVFSTQLAKPLKASQLYNTLVQLLTPGRAGEEEVETVTDGKRARSALRILLAEDNPMNQK